MFVWVSTHPLVHALSSLLSMVAAQLQCITPHLPLIGLLAGLVLLGLRAFFGIRRSPSSYAYTQDLTAGLELEETLATTKTPFVAHLPLPVSVSFETLPPLVPPQREPRPILASQARRQPMPMPTRYASRPPVSMAQIIMARHMSRRSSSIPSPPKHAPSRHTASSSFSSASHV
ncbi:hypothetical protein B0H12DRAFT_1097501 [Mycena haematopus]|nr:hypothetical protein B0H12DRAFT_1097501 [Mycena haematopus]